MNIAILTAMLLCSVETNIRFDCNKLKIFMRAYTPHPVTYRDQRLQIETIEMHDGKANNENPLPSALPPPPITAELYNFLYPLINNFNNKSDWG